MNDKEQLEDFISRYHLNGNINRALIDVGTDSVFTSAFNTDSHVYCEINMRSNPFNDSNVELGVSNTEKFKRLLSGFEDPEIQVYYNEYNKNDPNPHSIVIEEGNVRSNYVLATSGVIKPYPKDLPEELENSIFGLTIDEELKDKFNKFKLMLKDETRSFSFFQRSGKLHVLFGMERFVGSDNISIELDIKPNKEFRDEIIFSVDTFNSIINSNEDCKIDISVVKNGMLIKCVSETFVNRYMVASSKNKQK